MSSIHRNLQRVEWLLILNLTKTRTKPLLAPIVQILPPFKTQHWAQWDHSLAAAPLLFWGHIYWLSPRFAPRRSNETSILGGLGNWRDLHNVRTVTLDSQWTSSTPPTKRPHSQIKPEWKSRYSHQSPSVLLMKPCRPEWMGSDDAALLDEAVDLSAKKKKNPNNLSYLEAFNFLLHFTF